MADKQADAVASSEGGPKTDRSSEARATNYGSGKMENNLEMNKANKVETTEATDVAGRKGKGTGTGLLEKLIPGKGK